MKQFKVTYSLQGTVKRIDDIPNAPPIVESESLEEVLSQLSRRLPKGMGCECVKVTVEEVE